TPMARNLLKAGHDLKVFGLVPDSVAALARSGATAAGSAREAVAGAQFVISMLPASRHVEPLYLGDDALLPHIDPQALVIECSTIAPDTARTVAAAAQARGLAMTAAPVSGGTAGAAAATLTFIVGGEPAALERGRPLLEKMGKNIFH